MSPNLMVLCNQCFGFQFSSKIHSRKLLPLLNSSFFTELTVFNQMGLFSRNLKSSLEVKGAKRKFSDNLGHNILELCNVLVNIRLTTSKTQRDIQDSKLRIRVASGLAERPDSQDLMKKGNNRKISNCGGDIAQCPLFLPEIKLQQQQSKKMQKQISTFSCPVQFYLISLSCSKYFVQDCLSKQSFGIN